MSVDNDPLAALFGGTVLAIARAIEAGDEATVASLATATTVNTKGQEGVTLALLAVRLTRPECLQALLKAGADPTAADDHGTTAVHLAAAAPQITCLEVLLAGGADPNAANPVTGERPLEVALISNRPIQFEMLLRAGADPNLTDRNGSTALHRAALVDDAERVLDLLQAGAIPDKRNAQGCTFQDYLWMTPLANYGGESKAARLRVQHWLRNHGIAIIDPHTAEAGESR